MKNFNFIIIGQGSAAFAAAIRANSLKLQTLVIGTNITKGTLLGGTCVNVGCVPSKFFINNSQLYRKIKSSNFVGFNSKVENFDYSKITEYKNNLVLNLRKKKYREVIDNLQYVTYINGKAQFESNSIIKVENESYQAKHILIANGARINIPKVEGIEKIDFMSNEEALNLTKIPKNLCVIGAGPLGLEFASMFSNFGSKVTILQRGSTILTGSEPEVSQYLRKYLEEDGIEIITDLELISFRKDGDKKIIKFTAENNQKELIFDDILLATGRKPNSDKLGLEKIGIKLTDEGFIVVSENFQTSVPKIWAGGDVIGAPMLESLAAKHGSIIVDNAFQNTNKGVDLIEIPRVVFTYPEVASVGYTDLEANEKGYNCRCNTIPLELVPKAIVLGETRGIVKMVIEKDTNRILGIHLIAPHASEIIHEATMLIKFRKTIDALIDTVHVFPTLSEILKLIALSFYMDITKLSCCTQ